MNRSREWLKKLSKAACMVGLALVVVGTIGAKPRKGNKSKHGKTPAVTMPVARPVAAKPVAAKAEPVVAQDNSAQPVVQQIVKEITNRVTERVDFDGNLAGDLRVGGDTYLDGNVRSHSLNADYLTVSGQLRSGELRSGVVLADELSVTGEAQLLGGLHLPNLRTEEVHSRSVDADTVHSRSIDAAELVVSGETKLSGPLHSKNVISARGLDVSGPLHAKSITTNELAVKGSLDLHDVKVDDLEVRGAMSFAKLSASDLDVAGTIHARNIVGGTTKTRNALGGDVLCMGNTAIAEGSCLQVNEIVPTTTVDGTCTPNPNGVTCFKGNVGIACAPTGDHEFRVNKITPTKGNCLADVWGTTSFAGNVGVNECKELFVNRINPSFNDGCGNVYADHTKDAVTCFGGNLAVDPTCNNKLLVNHIDPVRTECVRKINGEYAQVCLPDPCGTTEFSGNVALGDCKTLSTNFIGATEGDSDPGIQILNELRINPDNRILVNRIDPVRLSLPCRHTELTRSCATCCDHEENECSDVPYTYEADEDGCTAFSGKVSIPKDLLVNRICKLGSDDCEAEPGGRVEICNGIIIVPNPEGSEPMPSCFSGGIAIPGDCSNRTGLVTRFIGAPDSEECPGVDEDGITCFLSNVGIAPNNTLYVKHIDSVADDCCSPGEGGCIEIGSKLVVNKDLLVNRICKLGSDCEEEQGGMIEICNGIKIVSDTSLPPVASCFTGGIVIPGDCDDRTGLVTRFIGAPDSEECPGVDEDGITCFLSNVGIAPNNTLYVNHIDPVGDDCCSPDHSESGTTCFSGNVAVNPERNLLANRLCAGEIDTDGNCVEDPCAPVEICNPVLEGDVKVHGNVLLRKCDQLKANFIGSTKPNHEGQICLQDEVAVNPERRMLVNFIDPVCFGPVCNDCDNDYTCPDCDGNERGCSLPCTYDVDLCGTTCFSGAVAVNPCRKLLTTNIMAGEINSNGECVENPDGCVTIHNLKLTGDCMLDARDFDPCFDQCVYISNPNSLCVNHINPVSKCPGECCCDLCGITCFGGDVGVPKKLLVNKINPVYTDECGNCYEDHRVGAATCFSASLAVEPRCGNKLLVNQIDPVRFDDYDCDRCVADPCGTTEFSGNVAVNECKVLKVDHVSPNGSSVTCFDGNVAVQEGRELLVNTICPVVAGAPCLPTCAPCNDCNCNGQMECEFPQGCICPQTCERNEGGCTEFTGNVSIRNGRTLYVNEINPVGSELCEEGAGPVCFSGDIGVVPGKELRVNRIVAVDSNCDEDPDGCVVIKNAKFDGELCFSSDLGIFGNCGNKTGLLTNYIRPVSQATDGGIGCEPKCVPNDLGCTVFLGDAGVAPGRILYVNEINPISSECGDVCMPADDGCTRFSGNVGIDRELRVNRIVPKGSDCAEDDGCVTIVNPRFEGEICVEGNIGAIGNCSDKKGVITNFIHAGKVNSSDPECPRCEIDEDGCIAVENNLIINSSKTLFVNQIDPVGDECGANCEGDEGGVTCFSGNVAVHPGRDLRVNRICSVDSDCLEASSGHVIICNPIFEGDVPDFGIPDCIDKDVKISTCNKLLVNYIDPVTDCHGECFEDTSPQAVTVFSGNVGIDNCRSLFVSRIDPGSSYADPDCCINEDCPEDCQLMRMRKAFSKRAITCFSGNVGIDCGRKLLINNIDPVRMVRDWRCCDHDKQCDHDWNCDCPRNCECPLVCKKDRDGTTCFSGKVGAPKGMLTNCILPVERTRPCSHTWECECPASCKPNRNGCIKLGTKDSSVSIPGKLLVCHLLPPASGDSDDNCDGRGPGIDENGEIRVHGSLVVDQDLDLNGTVRQPSDDRIKTDIAPIAASESLALIKALQPQRYNFTSEWQEATGMGGAQRGFIAQDLAEVLPELVHIASQRTVGAGHIDNFHSVDYMGLIPDLVGALQASHSQVEALQAEMELLKLLMDA